MTSVLQAQSKSLVRRFCFCQHPLPSSPAPDRGETKQDSCVTAVSLLRTQELPGYRCITNFMSCQWMELGPTVCPLVLNCMAWSFTHPAKQIPSPVGHPVIRTRMIRNYLLIWAKLLFTPIHWQNCTSPVNHCLSVGIPEWKAAKKQRKMDGKTQPVMRLIFLLHTRS